jgi:MFS transporter, DHA3 family, macrolide efflux protein
MIHGLRTLIIVWLGQLTSLIGSGVAGFALSIWVYQRTGSATQFALIAVCSVLPSVLLSPLAGALVDRWNHRWTMIFSDIGGALNASVIALLLALGQLEIWYICVLVTINSIITTFHWPAYTAATTLLVPKRHLGRAGGMLQMGQAIAQLVAPALGGLLLTTIQLQGVVLLELITYSFAFTTLLCVRFPKVKITPTGGAKKGSLLNEVAFGWAYLTSHPALLGLLIFFAASNFLAGIVGILFGPLVLAFASPVVLGTLLSIAGVGTLVSSLVISIWGGPQRRMHAVFSAMLLSGVCILVVGLDTSILILGIAIFIFFCSQSVLNVCIQVIFQRKVAPDIQGRIFALRTGIMSASLPLAYAVAGPLADYVFEPLMAPGGLLAGNVGQLIGVGHGRGIGLLFMIVGVLTIIVTVVAYQYSRLRLVEDELPDAIPDNIASGEPGLGHPSKFSAQVVK